MGACARFPVARFDSSRSRSSALAYLEGYALYTKSTAWRRYRRPLYIRKDDMGLLAQEPLEAVAHTGFSSNGVCMILSIHEGRPSSPRTGASSIVWRTRGTWYGSSN